MTLRISITSTVLATDFLSLERTKTSFLRFDSPLSGISRENPGVFSRFKTRAIVVIIMDTMGANNNKEDFCKSRPAIVSTIRENNAPFYGIISEFPSKIRSLGII